MAICKVSLSNQWPLAWFNMQIVTISDKMSTIIYDICHVRGGGT
jgi:hypothetical protein